MTGETNTLPSGGTDNAQLSETDTSESWDYYDPDEDQDTAEAPVESETADEPDEGEQAQEAEEQADEPEGEEEPEPQEAGTEFIVKRPDGSQVTVADLLKSEFRQSDYTRKSQELSNDRKAFDAEAQRFEGITQAFIDYLSGMIPAEPNASLALTDPNKYTAQKAQYDAAVAQVQKLVEIGSQPKEIKQERDQREHSARIADENRKLAELFPKTATEAGRREFWDMVQGVGGELGFAPDELKGVTDHRIFALAHWANLGMKAEKTKAKAKAKVEKAPPTTPRKPGQSGARANGNVEAMQRLRRSGSMRDALMVDFD
jgi:hypothetical protein